MRFLKISIVILSFFSLNVAAQQDAMYTQYMFNLSAVNSAAIGRDDYTSFMMVDRFQWVGVEGAPRSMSVTADMPVKLYNSGFGLSFINDRIGPERTNSIYLDYAYHIKLSQKLKLGMGLKAGLKIYSADFTGIGQPGLEDPQFAENISGDILPNFGFGLLLYGDNFYFGVSSPKMINHDYESDLIVTGGEERHYFAIGGYVLPLNEDIMFKPATALKMVKGAPLSFDITANFLFKEIIWAGVGYRSGDAVTFLVQADIMEKFKVGYAFDITISNMRLGTYGSHEVMLSYNLVSSNNKYRPYNRRRKHF